MGSWAMWAAVVLVASAMLAGCGGGGGAQPAREAPEQRAGPAPEQTGSAIEPTGPRTTAAGTTAGETTGGLSPRELRQAEAALLECQLEEAEAELGREGLGTLVDEMADELVERPDADFGQLLAERGYTCGRLAAP